jgi:hypothetical protein
MENSTIIIILAAALAVSEALSLIPALKANGFVQLIFGIIRYCAGKK